MLFWRPFLRSRCGFCPSSPLRNHFKSSTTSSKVDLGHLARWQNYALWRYVHSSSRRVSQKVASQNVLESTEDTVIAKPVPHSTLISGLQDCSSVEEQMMKLCCMLRLSQEDIKERLAIGDIVSDMMKPFFLDFKVQLFGSSVNSFGFKGCDIDMVFGSAVDRNEKMEMATDDSHIPSIRDVLEGCVTLEYMDKLAQRDQLIFMHTVFLDYYKDSLIAPLFINAYVPIIRFQYDKYQLKCDLSIGNRSAIVNTKLLYAFNELDERVAPLVMAVRYWGKHAGLIGGGLMFNTYCITLLLIYFLQTRTPPVLPSADFLLSCSESLKSLTVLEENVLEEVQRIPKSKNTQTAEQLLREFFLYYLYFDFTRVICPKTAKTGSRDEFAGNKRFKLNTICVQDPIKLTHNVSNLVDYRHCKKFAKEMLYASKLFQDKSAWVPQSSPWGLAALFDKPFKLDSMITDRNSWNLNIPVKSASRESAKEALLLKAAETIVKILEQGLLFKCQCIQLVDIPEDKVIDKSLGRFLLRAMCFGEHNTWLGRSSVDINNQSDASFDETLTIEHSVSLKLAERVNEEKKKTFKFTCNFYAQEIGNESSLFLTFDSQPNMNPILGIFLKEYLPKIASKLL